MPLPDSEEIEINHATELILLILMLAFFAAHLGIHVYHVANNVPPAERIPWKTLVPIFFAFAFTHALFMLGWRRALAFFGLTAVISFGFEYVGQATGLIFGPYYYTDVLGYKLLGAIPLVIPLSYFMVMYPCYIIANLLIGGGPRSRLSGWGGALWAAFLTAIVMTAWDLTLDPLMSGEVAAWKWGVDGPYFGVPFQNFTGWVLTTFTIAAAYRLVEPRLPLRPLGRLKNWLIALPLMGYLALSIGDIFIGAPEATRLISPFVMGVPVLAALLRLYEPRQ